MAIYMIKHITLTMAALALPLDASTLSEVKSSYLFTLAQAGIEKQHDQTLASGEQGNSLYDGKLSPTARQLVQEPKRVAPFEKLRTLVPSDRPALQRAFETNSLPNREMLGWAIAHFGDEAALQTLRGSVDMVEFGRLFTWRDLRAFDALIRAIGHVAQRSDSAYEYLLDKSKVDGWSHTSNWDSEDGMPSLPQRLAATALKALAITGRDGVSERINDFIATQGENLAPISGAVIDSVSSNWYVAKHGQDEIIKAILRGEMRNIIRLFYQTEEGKDWRRWYMRANEINQEEEPSVSP